MEGIVEVIREGEIVRMSETQAIDEDLFILRKIIEPEREPVEEEIPVAARKQSSVASISRLETWKARKFNYKKNRVFEDLLDNFHWQISRARRAKGLTRQQLADNIGANDEEMKMIEMGELPKDDFVLINKIESNLGINLRKEKKKGDVTLADLQKMDEANIQNQIEKSHMKEAGLEGEEERISGEDIEIVEE